MRHLSNRYRVLPTMFLSGLVLTFFASSALGQEANAVVDGIRSESLGWATNIKDAISRLFFYLATLDLIWLAIRLTLKSSPLEEWVSQLIKKILFYGIGLYFLRNGFSLSSAVVDSFVQLAGIASGSTQKLTATSIWSQGLETALEVFYDNGFWDGLKAQVFGALIALLILALAAYVSAVILLAYGEAFIVMGAGTVVLGLLGSDWTKDYGRKYLNFALMTGLKLFITLLIGQLGLSLISNWMDAIQDDNIARVFSGLASFIVFALLITKIPNTITSMMAGGGIQGSESVAAAAVKTAAIAATAAATGGAAAVTQASRLAKAEGAKGLGGLVGGTTKNLAKSFSEDVGRQASRVRGVSGSGLRMSSNMQSKIDAIKAKNEDTSLANSIGEGKDTSSSPTEHNSLPKSESSSHPREFESSPQMPSSDTVDGNLEQGSESSVSSSADSPKPASTENRAISNSKISATSFGPLPGNTTPQSKIERLQQRIKKREEASYQNPYTQTH